MPLKEEIESWLRKTEAEPSDYDGPDWWQVTPDEIAVFDIELERWARMMLAYQSYEVMLGLSDACEDEALEAALREELTRRPDIAGFGHSSNGFWRFAVEYCDLTMREADAVYAKMHFWHVLMGITTYDDEHEDETPAGLVN